jgi:hypothetical protein
MIIFYKIRIFFKSICKKFVCINSYCKDCGRTIQDFIVEDDVWKQVMGDSQKELCYDCFQKRAKKVGIYSYIALGYGE